MSGRETRARAPVNYSEKAVGVDAVPAWAKAMQTGTTSQRHAAEGKENERSTAAHRKEPAKEEAKKPAKEEAKKEKKRKAAGQSAPTRGRNAGVTVSPIKDLAKQPGGSKAAAAGQAGEQPEQQGGGKGKKKAAGQARDDSDMELVTRDVPGLAGVKQKRMEPKRPAAQDGPTAAAEPQPAAASKAAGGSSKRSSGKQKHSAPAAAEAAAQEQQQEEEEAGPAPQEQPAAKRQRSKGGSKSSAAAATAAAAAPSVLQQQHPQQQQQEEEEAGPSEDPVLARAAKAVAAAARAEAEAASVPALPSCELCQHFSDNFAALLGEYGDLQRAYEALKGAKLDTEVAELLKEHDRHVMAHCAATKELATQWKAEAGRRAAKAEEFEQVEQERGRLQQELLAAQAAVAQLQVEAQDREEQLKLLQARNELLERRVQIPDVHDQSLQMDGPSAHSAGVQAPSPLRSPSGVQMYEARGMIPEGAPGTMYRVRPAGTPLHIAGDTTYSVPATTWAGPAGGAAAAAAAGQQVQHHQGQQGQEEEEPSGSDMQLTAGEDAAAAAGAAVLQHVEVDLDIAAQRRLSPVAGRLAQAGGRGGGGKVVSKSPSPAQLPRGQQAQQQGQEAPSAQLTAESLVHEGGPGAAARVHMSLPRPAAQAAARRLSAPPAFGGVPGSFAGFNTGGIPLERQLQFASNSPASALPAVPEEETDEQLLQQGDQRGAAAPASVPAPPRERAIEMFGFQATPAKGGKHIFTDITTGSGFVFELGPAPPASPDEEDEEEGGPSEPELRYRPLQLGTLAGALPAFLHGEIQLEARYRPKLIHILLGALAEATGTPAGSAAAQQ